MKKAITVFWFTLLCVCISRGGLYSVTTLNSAITQDFDTLASSGTSSTVPTGWGFSESGTGANLTYAAGTGSGNAGNTYSFGAAGSTERAFGGLQSGSLIPTIGFGMQNNSGSTITSFIIAYTGEQWRLGATGRPDRLDFQYSTDANSLTTGTWHDADAFDFLAPVTGGTVGALDGNATANRTDISGTLSGITFVVGNQMWIRWSSFDATGFDDGLAIDNFSITAVPEPVNVALAIFGGIGATVLGVRRFVIRRNQTQTPV